MATIYINDIPFYAEDSLFNPTITFRCGLAALLDVHTGVLVTPRDAQGNIAIIPRHRYKLMTYTVKCNQQQEQHGNAASVHTPNTRIAFSKADITIEEVPISVAHVAAADTPCATQSKQHANTTAASVTPMSTTTMTGNRKRLQRDDVPQPHMRDSAPSQLQQQQRQQQQQQQQQRQQQEQQQQQQRDAMQTPSSNAAVPRRVRASEKAAHTPTAATMSTQQQQQQQQQQHHNNDRHTAAHSNTRDSNNDSGGSSSLRPADNDDDDKPLTAVYSSQPGSTPRGKSTAHSSSDGSPGKAADATTTAAVRRGDDANKNSARGRHGSNGSHKEVTTPNAAPATHAHEATRQQSQQQQQQQDSDSDDDNQPLFAARAHARSSQQQQQQRHKQPRTSTSTTTATTTTPETMAAPSLPTTSATTSTPTRSSTSQRRRQPLVDESSDSD